MLDFGVRYHFTQSLFLFAYVSARILLPYSVQLLAIPKW